jgi:hypothetical protein
MDTKLKIGLLASVLLWPFLGAAIVACLHELPTKDPADPLRQRHDPYHNWIGQGTGATHANALLLLCVVYVAKFLIGRVSVSWVRVYFFALLVIASLPFIWLLVVTDWRNPHVFKVACWVHDPIGFWFIPTISFAWDTLAIHRPSLRWYISRSGVELLLMVPWIFIWAFFSFFVLGGGWI